MTLIAVLAAVATCGLAARAQTKQLQLPNPYRLVENWPTLPQSMNGARWGELIRADIDPKGNIWVLHRCFNTVPAGAATCVGRSEPPILEFDPSGKLLASFGGGMFAFPHGFTADRQENVWASDANANETVLGMSAKDSNGLTRGNQVFKLSPSGLVLMTLGREGVAGNGPGPGLRPGRQLHRAWTQFGRPSALFVARDDTLYVSGSQSNTISGASGIVADTQGRRRMSVRTG